MDKKLARAFREAVEQDTPSLEKRSKRTKTSLYLDAELFAQFKALCDQKNRSMSIVLETLLRNYLGK